MTQINHDADIKEFGRLLTIMDELREQCPWDKKQTVESLRHLTIEEVYELADAIIDKDMKGVKEELGDLMLHLAFYARIASETKDFTMKDVIYNVCEKLIVRHPHIYGDVKVKDEMEVKANWEKIKLKEGKKSVLGGVPVTLPALVKATRIQDKVKGVGFEWSESKDVWNKVEEEMAEFQTEVEGGADKEAIEAEFGDVLFSLINYARFQGINPEDALEKTNKKFIKRFSAIEAEAKKSGKALEDWTLEEMDVVWQKAKS